MTKLYTLVFDSKRINVKKFGQVSPRFLNVDLEYRGNVCLGYEKSGRYTFNFKNNRMAIYLAEDFSNDEFKNMRLNLKILSNTLNCYSTSEHVYFQVDSGLTYS